MGGTNMSKLCSCTGRKESEDEGLKEKKNKEKKRKRKNKTDKSRRRETRDVVTLGSAYAAVANLEDIKVDIIWKHKGGYSRVLTEKEYEEVREGARVALPSPGPGYDYEVCRFVECTGEVRYFEGCRRQAVHQPQRDDDVDNSNSEDNVTDRESADGEDGIERVSQSATTTTDTDSSEAGSSKAETGRYQTEHRDIQRFKERIEYWRIKQQQELATRLSQCAFSPVPSEAPPNRANIRVWSRHLNDSWQRLHGVNIDTRDFNEQTVSRAESGRRVWTGHSGVAKAAKEPRDMNRRSRDDRLHGVNTNTRDLNERTVSQSESGRRVWTEHSGVDKAAKEPRDMNRWSREDK